MSTSASERLSVLSTLNLGFKVILSKAFKIWPFCFFGFLVPLIALNISSWLLGFRAVNELRYLFKELAEQTSIIEAMKPFIFRWAGVNLLMECLVWSCIIVSYLCITQTFIGYFDTHMPATRSPGNILRKSLTVFFQKVLLALVVVIPILVITQFTIILGLYVLFMLMMAPVLMLRMQGSGVRIIWDAIFLKYARSMHVSRMDIAFLLMGLGGSLLLLFLGLEYALTEIKKLEIRFALPAFVTEPIHKDFPISILTMIVEILEPIGISCLLVVISASTTSAFGLIEQRGLAIATRISGSDGQS